MNINDKKDDEILLHHQYDKMTNTPVSKLIVSLAIPTIISMLITTIYNMADTYFVSKIGVSASGATGVLFSLMAVLQAFGFMFGHGSGSCISRLLGAGDIDKARQYSSTGFFLAFVSGFIIMVFGLLFLSPFMTLLGSTKTILPYAKAYGTYILIAGPAMTTGCVMNNILRYEGKASLAMIGLGFGGVLNIALDPLFMFKLNMGISGAGLATALSQYISMIILFSMFKKGKTESRLSVKYITLRFAIIKQIVVTGLPSLARQGLNSVSNMVLNISAAAYGDVCIAAMSIVLKCANFIFSVAVGIGQGLQPVSAFNYGAKKYSRVNKGVKFTLLFGTFVIAVLSGICFVVAPNVICLFRSDKEIVEIGSVALRYMCISLVFLPTIMTANMTFQSIGKSGRALFLACTQNGLVFIPCVLIMTKLFGLLGLQLAQPLSYIIAVFISAPFIISFIKKLPPDADKNLE